MVKDQGKGKRIDGERAARPGQPRLRGQAVAAPAVCFLGAWLLMLTGCSHLNRTPGEKAGDPLLGGVNLRPPVAVPATGPAATAPTAQAQPANPQAALPFPPANSGLSNAALAAGMSKPFDKDHDLRIGAPGPTAADGWARQDAGPAGNGSAATLRGPVPLAEAGSQPDARQPAPAAAVPPQTAPAAATPPAAQGSRLANLDQLEAQVHARGALWHRLDKIADTGEYKFSCSVPNRRKPGSRRTYEARARDALVAVQAVLDQIDKDQ